MSLLEPAVVTQDEAHVHIPVNNETANTVDQPIISSTPAQPTPIETEPISADTAPSAPTAQITHQELVTASNATIDADQSHQQRSPRSSLGPHTANRKSLIMKSAPRVPSTLRRVVDATDSDLKDDADADNTNNYSTWRPVYPPGTPPLPPLPTKHSSPLLRRDYSEPTLMNLVDKSTSSTKCLPYPHTLDSYIPRQRPHSLNTLSSMSCRLSIITSDVDYTEYSRKKKALVVVRPSKVRGWARMLSGKLKVTFLSPFLR
ncbi:hypothetical protein BX661DRAFT_195275 [Kickxella alabastrina]|uniref:uncharacterized protein n=1 Tax=Kickxella alabastrina TaxID=61397 RepID=UPI00221F3107|nr:uncharacterized protein BX661DRAFT_195275 [Kickxella alabastrina]KAI7834659.1 hypothetical protein BX661DRAFT_195275 [Kickxella alabastrina]